ncbi:MAG TPA: metallopeptidase TldD-related protein [Spirochaetia bacterium]|nr:metallopeptidase TldD-related protein [Spirochaetales bacterium]HRS64687.1 metallopeptidase TldD-related protein [Spirochaetia bacterium]HOT60641.1 metallopeptidase TldD-related protein [Spirochaetales bacterium]HPD80514.1 metallopeptidase TldD-related protein [Spirochaetales bacterium]HQK34333.1 metallopeptidase TldD-related protein [Spirochaetales bacterium]
MLERIKELLQQTNTISDFRITEIRKSGLEWYLIGKEIETARSKDTLDYEVAVYVDSNNGSTRGACIFHIQPTMSVKEITASINRAVQTAESIHNDWYPIPEAHHANNPAPIPMSQFAKMSLSQAMQTVCDSLYKHNGLDGATINSLEIFLTKIDEHIINSRGIDIYISKFHGYTEYIVNAGSGKEEIELYDSIHFSEPLLDTLSNTVRLKLKQAHDRLAAIPTPDCSNLPVIFSGSPAEEFYRYWFQACQNSAHYQHTSPFALGENISVPDATGDTITLSAVPFVSGSPFSRPYDSEGFALKPITCIDNGILTMLTGPLKYAHYLKQQANGSHPLFELSGGKQSKTTLTDKDHLEAVSFSDFYLDPSTGNFGGELRLGYLVTHGNRIPVTGGSITGSIPENRGMILFSRELVDYATCRAPEICLVPHVRIAKAT